MSRRENLDSVAVRPMSLSDMVDLCTDCAALCLSRTERVVTNSSRAPRGWESLYHSVAEERRNDDLALCERRCRAVHQGCPSGALLRRYEAAPAHAMRHNFHRDGKDDASSSCDEAGKDGCSAAHDATPVAMPSIQAISRCEHAAETFASTLFLLAHKPSKFIFDNTLSQNGSGSDSGDGSAWPEKSLGKTEVHQKVLRGAGDIDAEIMRRWSTARRERLSMQDQGILRSDGAIHRETTMASQTEAAAEKAQSGAAARATTPRW